MHRLLEGLAAVGIAGFAYLILFVILVLWVLLTEGLKRLASVCTQILSRLIAGAALN